MRITIVGPGAVGLLWASHLALAGATVTILDHRPERAALLTAEGIRLEDPQGETHLTLPASADPQEARARADLALICVKAYHTQGVAQTLASHLPAAARALTLQNGAGNVEALVAALGPGRVLGGITSEGATLLGPGRVRHTGRGQTHLGPALGQPDAFCAELAGLFDRAGFACQVVEGVQNLIWTKLIINVGINALTAILGVPNGRLLELPAAKALMVKAVDEAMAVGQALGVAFLHANMQEAVMARRTAHNISSMLQDTRAKRRTEVEFINGYVAAAGQGLGLACPVNQTLARLVLALEQNQG
ncbi:2-dehydropantoate 2-reductase [Desulfarculales bacterium]